MFNQFGTGRLSAADFDEHPLRPGRHVDFAQGRAMTISAASSTIASRDVGRYRPCRGADGPRAIDVWGLRSIADPRTVLLDLGKRAAMIVVGSRGRGPIAGLLLGWVSVLVSRHASCPVVVWSAGEANPACAPDPGRRRGGAALVAGHRVGLSGGFLAPAVREHARGIGTAFGPHDPDGPVRL